MPRSCFIFQKTPGCHRVWPSEPPVSTGQLRRGSDCTQETPLMEEGDGGMGGEMEGQTGAG